jgi:S-adenosyl-L-methionine hydrolase (adenosine-forming)
MKGVILSICPSARLVDLTHDLAPQDVLAGSLALAAAVPFFPEGTVHLAVVDPGVGSARRPVALRVGGHYLVGPDNGLFTFALATGRSGPGSRSSPRSKWSAVTLSASEYRLPVVSLTFHGRDVFAPAAAYLAAGVPLERLGPPVTDPVRLELPGCRLEGGELVGEVIDADRFGNLLTSIEAGRLAEIPGRGAPAVEVAGRPVGGLVDAYAEGPEGDAAVIVGSTGRLEVFVKSGSARHLLGVGRGAGVRVRRRG